MLFSRDVTVDAAGEPGAAASDHVSRAASNAAIQKALKDANQAAQDVRDKELIQLAQDGADRRAQTMMDGADRRSKTLIDGLSLLLNPKPQASQAACVALESYADAAKRKIAENKCKLRIFKPDTDFYKNALKELVSQCCGVPVSDLTDAVMSAVSVEDVLKYAS